MIPARPRRRGAVPGGRVHPRKPGAVLLVVAIAAAGVIIGLTVRSGPAAVPVDERCSRAVEGADTAAAGSAVQKAVFPLIPVGRAVGRGENLAVVLTALGLSPEHTNGAVEALAGTDFDFQRLMPGDSLTLKWTESPAALPREVSPDGVPVLDTVPVRLRYHVDLATSYEVRFGPETVEAVRVVVPVETTVVALVGGVRGSLWQSVLAAGGDDRLAAAYTCILRHRLPAKVHPGDSFGLVVERMTVADSFYGYGRIHALRYRGDGGLVEAFHHARPDGLTFYCDPDGRSLSRVLGYPPVAGARITSDFGPRVHPVARRRTHHSGIDYEAPYGTPVRAVADGVVGSVQRRRGYGRVVDINHPRLGLKTRYAHLSRCAEGIGPGVRVSRGDTVGYIGSTGLSSGAHLHFETIRGGRQVNPLDALPSGFEEVAPEARSGFERFVADCRALIADARVFASCTCIVGEPREGAE